MQTQERIPTEPTRAEAGPLWSLPSGRTESAPVTWATFVECRRRARVQRKAFHALLAALA